MNTSTFTTEQLRKVIPLMVKLNKGVNVNECGFDESFCEFSLNDEIEIKSAEETNGSVYVNFELHYPGENSFDNMDAWTYNYSTIQTNENIKEALVELEKFEHSDTHCQCLYEIENHLPRTKFCMIACKAQRELTRRKK